MVALEEVPIVHYYIDCRENKIFEISEPLLELLKYPKEEFINQELEFFFDKINFPIKSSMLFDKEHEGIFLNRFNSPYRAIMKGISMESYARIEFLLVEDFTESDSLKGIYQLVKNSLQPMAIYDAHELKLIYSNCSFSKLFGCDPDNNKALDKAILQGKIGLLPKEYECLMESVIKKCKPLHKKIYIRKHGDALIKFSDISLIPIAPQDRVEYIIFSLEDICQVNEQKDLIQKEKESLYSIINYLDIPMLHLSYPELRLMRINHCASKLFKELFNVISPIYIYDILTLGIEDYSFIINDLENIQETKYYKSIHIGKKIFNIICQPHKNIDDNILEIIIIFIDVTEEVEKRDEISNLLKAQEEFFAFISHEFKTPITVTLSAVQVMEFSGREEASPLIKKYINKIKKSAFQQLRLVNNLLDISRADSGYLKINRKNIDLVEVTRVIIDSIELYAKEKGIDIVFNSAIDPLIMALDEEKYERILLNLLSNAIKFTPSGKNIYVDISEKGGKAVISVKDEGIGIPKDKLKYIFERYAQVNPSYSHLTTASSQENNLYSLSDSSYSHENNFLIRNHEGTGIGLCLAKLMTKALGGDIVVFSEVGKGATFLVHLPKLLVQEENGLMGRDVDYLDDRLMRNINIEFSNLETS
ncbi:sensor histidine kinase [Alloiococcus sp. CFN-8]|uniref:sensor histidine kinase n=1 Tax=Alloiococcus sp. CFN-8 TaxID=3416081 RepID=UPI003CE84A13